MSDASTPTTPETVRPSIWSRPERGSRGPAPGHTRDAIVATAIALADADGLAAVSMRGVAAALGTSGGSLYRYLSSRDDLLDLMTDAAVGELGLSARGAAAGEPQDPAWLDQMMAVGRRQLDLYRRHPWLLDVMERPTGIGPHGLAWFDDCLRILEPVPCSTMVKFEAIAMMTGVVSLVARSQKGAPSFPSAGIDLATLPHLAAAFSAPPGPAPEADLFERVLRVLLTGLLTTRPAPEVGDQM